MAAYARDVNIFIWSSRKSVGHETNDRVMVHGNGTRADGRSSSFLCHIQSMLGSRVGVARRSLRIKKYNVVRTQAAYLARTTTEAPETQIYFIKHGSGAFPGLRLRTVVRGERASRSIVNRTTALWSIWVVASLILSGFGYLVVCVETDGREVAVSRGSNRVHDHAHCR